MIITCYDQGRFLAGAIKSAQNQSLAPSELIVVDDGSNDATAEIAREFRDITFVSQGNSGLSAARNKGLDAATATFVVFLDADDLLYRNAIRLGVECFATHPDSAFVFGGYCEVGIDGARIAERLPEATDDHYSLLLAGNCVGMHGTVMYRRTTLSASGGFDLRLKACEDYDVYLRLSSRFRVASHRNLVAEYRKHGSNMSNDSERMLNAGLSVLRAQRECSFRDKRRRKAYKEGLRHWQRLYGTLLVLEPFHRAKGTVTAIIAARKLMYLIRVAPWSLPLLLKRALVRSARPIAARVPPTLRRSLQFLLRADPPFIGGVRFGDFRRTAPIDPSFGFQRGLPVDRYYIERFLDGHADDVFGTVLEVGNDEYTRRFGGCKVERADVVDVDESNPRANIIADLSEPDCLPDSEYCCVICTQTLHLIYHYDTAIREFWRTLRPGGVLLATVPGITQIDRGKWRDSWYWSFTPASCEKAFKEVFGPSVTVQTYGNVLAAVSFLEGLSAAELTPPEFDSYDPSYPVVITVRAVKNGSES